MNNSEETLGDRISLFLIRLILGVFIVGGIVTAFVICLMLIPIVLGALK